MRSRWRCTRASMRSRRRQRPASASMRPGPAEDVELAHRHAQARHALALLGRGHRRRAMQRIGGLFDVVRVHDQRLGQLARGAGEAAEDQHALLVVARGDELLAHQVHAVVQAGHHADVGGAEQLVHGVVLVVLGQQVHRLIVRLAEALVDALGDALRCAPGTAVFVERAARRRGDLHEDEAADPLRALLEQPLDRMQALEDALGVVEAVDADREAGVGGQAEPLEDRRRHSATGGQAARSSSRWPFDRDRIALDQRLLVLVGDRSSARARCAPRGSGRRSR